MTERLNRDEVSVYLGRLRGEITDVQASRLRAIVALLADDGRFVLRDALVAGEFPAGDAGAGRLPGLPQERQRRRGAGARSPVGGTRGAQGPTGRAVRLVHRGDLVDEGLTEFTGSAAGRTGVAYPVDQAVAEVGSSRRTRVYVSHPTGAQEPRIAPLLERLRTDLALDTTRTWDVTDGGSPRCAGDRRTTPGTMSAHLRRGDDGLEEVSGP